MNRQIAHIDPADDVAEECAVAADLCDGVGVLFDPSGDGLTRGIIGARDFDFVADFEARRAVGRLRLFRRRRVGEFSLERERDHIFEACHRSAVGAVFGGEIAVRFDLVDAPTVHVAESGDDCGGASFGAFENAGGVVGATGDFDADVFSVARAVTIAGVPTVAIEGQTLDRFVFIDGQVERRR